MLWIIGHLMSYTSRLGIKMTTRGTLAKIGLGVLSMVSVLAIYLWSLSPSERWLVLRASEAESYAQMMLAGRNPCGRPIGRWLHRRLYRNKPQGTIRTIFTPRQPWNSRPLPLSNVWIHRPARKAAQVGGMADWVSGALLTRPLS